MAGTVGIGPIGIRPGGIGPGGIWPCGFRSTCARGLRVTARRTLREEPLELRAELVAAGQVAVVGEQRGAALLRGDIGVVLVLERGDDALDLLVAADLLVDLLADAGRGLAERGERDVQPGVVDQSLEHLLGGLGEVRLRQIVGHVHGES